MPLVHVKEDESFENALRRFKRKCEKSGILSELKKRQHYEKPSTKRKRKAIAARKKVLRKLAEERGMDVVVDAGSTLYVKPALDLTKEAVAAFDQAYPVSPAPAAAK